ncbi:hypothetical protein [Streptomyces sp. SYSU K21746]
MDVVRILEGACLLVPEVLATENDITASDVWDYLAHDEWEVALDLLQELGGSRVQPGFWDEMERAAGQLGLERSRAWCRWRSYEAGAGIIRADLVLRSAGESFRRTPIPGAGILRPMWDIGTCRDEGESELRIAAMWVEFAPELPPGGRAAVRLLPLDPTHWRGLAPGDVVTLYECARPGGTATILEVPPPAVQALAGQG